LGGGETKGEKKEYDSLKETLGRRGERDISGREIRKEKAVKLRLFFVLTILGDGGTSGESRASEGKEKK